MNKLVAEKKKKVQALDLDRRVAKLRKKAALEAAREISKTSPNSVASHFSFYINSLPLPEEGGDIEFNNRVTELALDRYVLPLTDPHEVLYLGSKLVEQSFYQIFRSSDPSEPIKNLSVSKHFGVFFTPKSLAVKMVEQLRGGGTAKKLLDPCAGAGVLLGEAMIQWRDLPYHAYAGIELDGNICGWANKILDRVAGLVGFLGDVAVTQGDGLEVSVVRVFGTKGCLN